jgi:hypothetical protein
MRTKTMGNREVWWVKWLEVGTISVASTATPSVKKIQSKLKQSRKNNCVQHLVNVV